MIIPQNAALTSYFLHFLLVFIYDNDEYSARFFVLFSQSELINDIFSSDWNMNNSKIKKPLLTERLFLSVTLK